MGKPKRYAVCTVEIHFPATDKNFNRIDALVQGAVDRWLDARRFPGKATVSTSYVTKGLWP